MKTRKRNGINLTVKTSGHGLYVTTLLLWIYLFGVKMILTMNKINLIRIIAN